MKTAFNLSLLAAGALFTQAALAEDCSISIDSTDSMQFSTKELTVDAGCSEVELTLTHSGSIPRNAMGHNWVLTRAEDAEAVNKDGNKAGLKNEYVKPDDERVIANTPVIGGGEETSITFSIEDLDASGDYTFFCSFPGHYGMMNGSFRIQSAD